MKEILLVIFIVTTMSMMIIALLISFLLEWYVKPQADDNYLDWFNDDDINLGEKYANSK